MSLLLTAHLPPVSHIWSLVAPKVTHDPDTPLNYTQAIIGPDAVHWKKAIADELVSLRKHRTFKVIKVSDMTSNVRRIKTKWVFKIKRDTLGRITRNKARLTACGYAQKYGRDYEETFAPVVSSTSIRCAFALAAERGFLFSSKRISCTELFRLINASISFALKASLW